MQTFRKVTLRFVDGLGMPQPLDTRKQSTEFLIGGLLPLLILGGLAL